MNQLKVYPLEESIETISFRRINWNYILKENQWKLHPLEESIETIPFKRINENYILLNEHWNENNSLDSKLSGRYHRRREPEGLWLFLFDT